MGFEKFRKKSFTGMTKTAKFVDFLAEGKVGRLYANNCGVQGIFHRGQIVLHAFQGIWIG